MSNKVYNPKKLERLNNPARLEDIPPQVLLDKLALKDPKVLVDIGAGTGFFSKEFVSLLVNVKIYACDISDIMLEWITNNVSPRFPNVIPVKIKDGIIPLDNEIADLVFMINLHHELDDHEKILNRSRELLKQSGKILIVDWKKEEMKPGPSVDIRFTVEEVIAQLTAVGFTNIQSFELKKQFVVIGEK